MKGLPQFWHRYRQNRAAIAGAAVLLLVVLVAILGPILYPTDPFAMVGRPSSPPFGKFPLGTDVSGRDILAGIVHGAGVSLLIGSAAAFSASAIGIAFGAAAGYYGGWIDDALMRITEYFLTIPQFVFAVMLVAIFSPTVFTVTAAIAAVTWPSVARLARGEFISQRERAIAASAAGTSAF